MFFGGSCYYYDIILRNAHFWQKRICFNTTTGRAYGWHLDALGASASLPEAWSLCQNCRPSARSLDEGETLFEE